MNILKLFKKNDKSNYVEKYPDLNLGDQSPDFNGNVFQAHLVPVGKENITREDTRVTTIFAKTRQDAKEKVITSLNSNNNMSIEEWDIVITNGSALQWAK